MKSNNRLFLFALLFSAFLFGLIDPAFAQDGASAMQDAFSAESLEIDDSSTTDPSFADDVERKVAAYADKNPILKWLHAIFFDWSITIQDNDVNLAKLIIALILFLIGVKVSRHIGEITRNRVLRRFGFDRDFARFLERLLRVTLIILFGFMALDIAGIPITVFAFLGGAIAIAVGFGAQELLGNFIGGLILMSEKPIRQGDLIEFDDEKGKVEEIGPRCTRLRLPGNVDLLIPNKQLLENKLTNWTLTDEQVRSEVVVGVAYGSDTGRVKEIMSKAVKDHPRVDEEPEPIVLFEEFGDNSLVFRVFFWVTVKNFMDQRIIQSDIRYEIDNECREHGVTIAFPQRDVHLDTLSPLEVKLLNKQEDNSEDRQ